jgi:hypothetical protein
MKEYIEREALLELYADAPDMKFDMMSVPIPVVRQNILDMPAADVVEVVRCEECKFQDTCKRVIEIMPRQAQMGYLRGNLHYCEYGERRVDHEN